MKHINVYHTDRERFTVSGFGDVRTYKYVEDLAEALLFIKGMISGSAEQDDDVIVYVDQHREGNDYKSCAGYDSTDIALMIGEMREARNNG